MIRFEQVTKALGGKTILDEFNPADYDTLEAMIDFLKGAFGREIESCALAPATKVFVNRKISKVARYVNM